ncbi:MAG TPA: tRNA (guanosine(37)-N1)-methyltransferase TrmD [Gammaproteobacteria bacterium]|nr:tRNA (guanosine(37)-N1)-methyltransferase TrmD [Gammaproteobacteria bacterium]
MWVGLISLFPEMFTTLNYGITGRAIENGLLALNYWNPRHFALDKYHSVDDRPYGGGPGMVMKVQPLRDAISAAKTVKSNAPVIYLTPQGRLLNQSGIRKLATYPDLIIVCGRYEGIDERLITTDIDEEWSIGDYVLSGGELAGMVLVDALTRFLPGALGHPGSAEQDSFCSERLDYPHYTRPEIIDGLAVPAVLNSGNHAEIARWRQQQALGRTWQRRPDLFNEQPLTDAEQVLLREFISNYKEHS